MLRLETATKFYEILITQDLLGDTVLICYFGGKNSHRHQTKTIKLDSFLQYCKAYKKIITTRFKHGYWFIHHSSQDF